MGTISDKLNKLKNTKESIKQAIIDKGVEVSDNDTFESYATKITAIKVSQGGEGGSSNTQWTELGYETQPQFITDGIEYAKQIKENWNPNVTSLSSKYSNNNNIVYFPSVDTSNVQNFYGLFMNSTITYCPHLDLSQARVINSMFQGCKNLLCLDYENWDISNVREMAYLFSNCENIKTLDLSKWNTSNVSATTNMFNAMSKLTHLNVKNWTTTNFKVLNGLFQGCSKLETLDLTGWDTSNVTGITSLFYQCSALTRVDGAISFKSFSSSTMNYANIMGYGKNKILRKLTLKDIGYQKNAKQFNNTYAEVWGIDSDEVTDARQSLIDSLITYSYDRATAGYDTCTVTLAANTKAVLTDDEIAAITAKGFTIV